MPTRRRALGLALAAALTASATATTAFADEGDDLVCAERHSLDPWQLVRRLSLDLAGTAPSVEQLEAVSAVADDPVQLEALLAELTDTFIEGDGFRQTTRRMHEAMLWPNIENIRLSDIQVNIRPDDNGVLQASSAQRRRDYRGDADGNCGNFRHTRFNPNYLGQFRPLEQNGGYGWREIEPYWAPGTTVRVCAHEAQETTAPGGVRCDSREGLEKKACGCGKDLRFCYVRSSERDVSAALREQLLRTVDAATATGADYTKIVLGTTAWQDGRIAHWKRHLAPNSSIRRSYNVPDPDEQVLGKKWDDQEFAPVELGPEHAGVLTLPGFLLKFQTGRGRANRFRQAFQCQSFEPPATTEDSDCSDSANDLTNRCTCRYCHATLEPLAIGFERFAEAGTTLQVGAAGLPKHKTACEGSNDEFCKRFYVTGNGPRAGWLLPLEFAAKHGEYETRFEEGPRGVVEHAIWSDDGAPRTGAGGFANCSARRMFVELLRRTPTEVEEETITELATDFAGSGFDYRGLVRAVVSNDSYRRIR